MENKRRTIAKTFSWRITATIITMLVSWLIIGSIEPALKIGGIEFFAKMFIYYFHERAWLKIPFGKPEYPEYNI